MSIVDNTSSLSGLSRDQIKRALTSYMYAVIVDCTMNGSSESVLGKFKVVKGKLELVNNSEVVTRALKGELNHQDLLEMLMSLLLEAE